MRISKTLCGVILLCCATSARPQDISLTSASQQIGAAETDIEAVDKALDSRVDPKDAPVLRAKAIAAQSASDAALAQLEQQLTPIDARVAGLGPVIPGVDEAADIQAQRTVLVQQRSAIDSAMKRGRLARVNAVQLIDELDRNRAEQISRQMSTRIASPLSPDFWRDLLKALPRDARRYGHFVKRGGEQLIDARNRGSLQYVLLGAVAAVLLLLPLRRMALHFGQRFLVDGAPGHRVRRSASALWRILVGTLAPALAAFAFVQGLRWSGLIAGGWSPVVDALIPAAGISAFIASIGSNLLMPNQPSWRLAPIGDAAAGRLLPTSLLLAAVAFIGIMVEAMNTAVGVSAAGLAGWQAILALTYISIIGATLLVLGRLRNETLATDDDTAASAGLGALTLIAWLLVGVSLLASLAGYIGLSLFVPRIITWATILASSAYLLMAAVDDLATSVFKRDSRLGRTLTRSLGLRGSVVNQFGELLSGVLRLAVGLFALSLLLAPFGAGFTSAFTRLGLLAQGVDVGGVLISPGVILRSLAVLFIGLGLTKLFMRWLDRRYLPSTDLDGSGRNSISLVTRYIGVALAVIWALASLGIGIERVALLLSALSVGIGFGLQAITQNFVSGLILLAERPIKIGDLIRVGTDEGDVKRISVRSTEIELADHSTLIVPNSELITKSVLNKTLAGPLGRIQIQFSVPIQNDAEQVRSIVLDAFGDETAVLDTPSPSVFVDSISDGRILFNCFAHVAGPRVSYGARSNILIAIMARLRAADIDIGTVPIAVAPKA